MSYLHAIAILYLDALQFTPTPFTHRGSRFSPLRERRGVGGEVPFYIALK
ncbi:hypothetical protein [Coleofasciculus sp. FACHB-712]|nr:hypothetical protein [Coleofasciculus sp. FACHB-712]